MVRASKNMERPVRQKANILLVDDREENLLVLEGILSDLDQNLIKAASGEEALKILLSREIAVILLDVLMPNMDGFETASLIRERDKSRHTPIIFITGISTQENHVSKGYSLGAVDYIFKPLVPEVLRSKVSAFVELFIIREQIKQQSELLAKRNEELKQEISERNRAEKELLLLNQTLERRVAERTAASERRAQELARSNSELEQFAYVASHDMKEPLRMVANYCDLLQKRYSDRLDQKAKEYIAYAVDGATRMHQIIHDLLAISRLGINQDPFQVIQCESVFQRACKNLKITIQEKGARVTHDALPALLANETQFEELFQNLIGNGIKFHNAVPSEVHISAQRDEAGKRWIFSVKDNGIGIEPQYHDRIFNMFCRLNNTKEYSGSGIGLAICKKIIELHSGNIWVESDPKRFRGSTFYFTIPDDR